MGADLAGTSAQGIARPTERVRDDLEGWVADEAHADGRFTLAMEDARCRADLLRQLAAVRAQLGLSQSAVARAMETTQSAVSELEGGATDPRLSTLQRYARAVNCQLFVHLAAESYGPWQLLAHLRGASPGRLGAPRSAEAITFVALHSLPTPHAAVVA